MVSGGDMPGCRPRIALRTNQTGLVLRPRAHQTCPRPRYAPLHTLETLNHVLILNHPEPIAWGPASPVPSVTQASSGPFGVQVR